MSFPCRIHLNASPCYPLRQGGFCNSALPEKNGHFHGGHTGLPAGPGSECPSLLYAGSASPYAVRHPLEYRNAYWRSPMLTPESFDLNGVRPFVRILSEKVRARRGRPPKDEVRLVPLTDISYVRQMESWMITTGPVVVNHYGP